MSFPQHIVFYNGVDDSPERFEMELLDAYDT